MSRAAELVARLVKACMWGLLALIATVVAASFYLSPFVALWYLLP